MPRIKNISIADAEIIFPNFSGKPGRYNAEGDRNFKVILNQEDADILAAQGWNVQVKVNKRDPDGDPTYVLPVKVSYDNYPPKIYLVTSHKKELLDEDTVGELDNCDIVKIDLTIRPYPWEVNGKTGIKAYVHTMYVTIEEDRFADSYNFNEPMEDDDAPL